MKIYWKIKILNGNKFTTSNIKTLEKYRKYQERTMNYPISIREYQTI